MTADPPTFIDRDAVDAPALACWAALCEVADAENRRMRWGRVVRLAEAEGDEPDAEDR
jgi:hypothetical protein